MLKAEDYCNVFSESHVGAIQKAMRRLGIVCGTLGLTASKQLVLFFERGEREMIRDAVKKMMVRELTMYSRSSIFDHGF